MKNIHRSVLNAFIYTGITIFQKAISFLMLPLYTIFFSPQEYGMASMVISLGNFFILLFNYALDEAAARFYFENRSNSEQLKKVLGVIVSVSLLFSVGGGFLLYVCRDFIYDKLIEDITLSYVLLGLIVVVTSPLFSIYQKLQRIQERAIEYSLLSFFYSIIQIILTLIFVLYFKLGVVGYLSAIAVASLGAFIYCFVRLYGNIRLNFNFSFIKEILKYSSQIVPHTLSSWGLNGYTQIVLGNMISTAAVGIYSAMNFSGTILLVLVTSLTNVWQPWLYKRMERGDEHAKRIIISMSKLLVGGFIVLSFFLSLFTEEIVHLFINERYYSGMIITPFLVFSSLMQTFGTFYVFVLYYEKTKVRYVSYSTLYGIGVNIVLSLFFIPLWGILGGVLALCIANFVISFCRQLYVSRVLQTNVMTLGLYGIAVFNLVLSYFAIVHSFLFSVRIIICIIELSLLFFLLKKELQIALNYNWCKE